MKASLFAVGILLGAVACTAPQGKKLGTTQSGGLAPVAAGPNSATTAIMPATAPVASTTLTVNDAVRESGHVVSITKDGTVTVMLGADQQDGYTWRLEEVPDPTVLKVASQSYVAPASGVGRGQDKWVFQAVGPGDVNVKMWYGNIRVSAVSANATPTFNFIAAVSDQIKPAPKTKTVKPKKTVAAL